MRPRACLFGALLLGVLISVSPGQEDPAVKRRQRLANYLKRSAQALHGNARAQKMNFAPRPDNLWREAEDQYQHVFGSQRTKEQFGARDKSVKVLENRVFEVLQALWGERWREAFHPLPEETGSPKRPPLKQDDK